MIDQTSAASLAAEYGDRKLAALGQRTWRPTRFDGGWLLTAEGDDLLWRTGVTCLVLLDDGSIHEESASLPPDLLIERYRRGATERAGDPGEAETGGDDDEPEGGGR